MKSRQIRVLASPVLSLITCFLTVFSPVAVIAEEVVAPNPLDEACVRDLLGDGWQRDKNIVLWEPGDLERLDPSERTTAQMLQDLIAGFGVVQAAEYSYSKTEGSLDNVALRIFVFSDAERAAAHRHRKYESERSAPYYTKTEEGDVLVFDSTQTHKRILFRGTLWVTSGQLGDSGLHRAVLEECLEVPR